MSNIGKLRLRRGTSAKWTENIGSDEGNLFPGQLGLATAVSDNGGTYNILRVGNGDNSINESIVFSGCDKISIENDVLALNRLELDATATRAKMEDQEPLALTLGKLKLITDSVLDSNFLDTASKSVDAYSIDWISTDKLELKGWLNAGVTSADKSVPYKDGIGADVPLAYLVLDADDSIPTLSGSKLQVGQLPLATTSDFGAIKAPSTDNGLTITSGVLDVNTAHYTGTTEETRYGTMTLDSLTEGLSLSNGILSLATATSDTLGTIKVPTATANGLSVSSGELKLGLATASDFGAIKVTESNGLSVSSGVLAMATADSNSTLGTVKLDSLNSGLSLSSGSLSFTPSNAGISANDIALEATLYVGTNGNDHEIETLGSLISYLTGIFNGNYNYFSSSASGDNITFGSQTYPLQQVNSEVFNAVI